jgi:phospholipid transport system transporter-binding protein
MPAKNKQPLVAFDHTSTVVGETLMLAGALNLANMSRLLAETAAYIAQPILPEALVIDFAEVTDVDSSGVALLLHWRREALKLGKALRYVHLPPNLASLAELYSVDEMIHCPTQKQTPAVAAAQ